MPSTLLLQGPWVATYGGLKYHAYRITWQDGSELGAYYGIDGMDWTHPPLFENAKTDVIGGAPTCS